jgi:hypothetical protein
MPSKNPAQRLSDIIDNVDAIAAFTAGLDFQVFRVERKTVYAVVRALEIISEASRRLPDKLLHRHPEIDWAAVGHVCAAVTLCRRKRRQECRRGRHECPRHVTARKLLRRPRRDGSS